MDKKKQELVSELLYNFVLITIKRNVHNSDVKPVTNHMETVHKVLLHCPKNIQSLSIMS